MRLPQIINELRQATSIRSMGTDSLVELTCIESDIYRYGRQVDAGLISLDEAKELVRH